MMKIKLAKNPTKISNLYTRSLRLTMGQLPQAVARLSWGIDPGVNFGLTILDGDQAFIFHGSLVQDDKPGRYGLIAYMFLEDMLLKYSSRAGSSIVIEGAAYGAPFRQVELSELRTGFYLAAARSTIFRDVEIKPPAAIRKRVFGDGKTQAMDEWPLLNHNAADSLAIALYAAQL